MDDIFIYLTDLPSRVHDIVVPCADGYTVYLEIKDSMQRRMKAFEHAVGHIRELDFEKTDVNIIEMEAHRRGEAS